jgi:hypothetical protein
VHLVLQDQFLGFGDAGVGFALIVLDDEFHVHAAELAAMFVEVHLEAVDHVLADLREDARHRRDVADAQFFGAGGGGQAEAEGKTTAHQHFVEPCRHCHSSRVVVPDARQEGFVASFFTPSSLLSGLRRCRARVSKPINPIGR